MQPLALAQDISGDYRRYIETTFPILDAGLRQQITEKIKYEHLLWKGPYVSLSRPFTWGASVADLVGEGVLAAETARCFSGWTLYDHQERAARQLVNGKPTIVASSTGSGKTESFLIPIIDYCLRHKRISGTKAVLMYPMNALANDQLKRLRRLLKGTGITFARYTGDTQHQEVPEHERPEDVPDEERLSRERIQAEPPDILLTNYAMLELLLVRREDQRIFHHKQVRYLVLDEVHTYGGARGIEVGCLIRRFKEHVDRSHGGLVCVGTSATVKGEDMSEVADFASKLFAEEFTTESIILERFDQPAPVAHPYWPALPHLEENALEQFDPDNEAQVLQLAERLCGRPVPAGDTLGERLGNLLEENALLRILEGRLGMPCEMDELIAYLKQQPERRGVTDHALAQEITAYLLIGSQARRGQELRLRPKVHMFFRGLEGFTRCLQCGHIWDAGITICPDCQSHCLPVEVCRSCGQDFWRAKTPDNRPSVTDPKVQQLVRSNLGNVDPYNLQPDEERDSSPRTLHLASNIHHTAYIEDEEGEDTGEEESANQENSQEAATARQGKRPKNNGKVSTPEKYIGTALQPIYICSSCGNAALEAPPGHRCPSGCGGYVKPMLYHAARLIQCPACRGRYGSREIVSTFGTGVAISVSILTSAIMKRLDEHERRLLIFSDNRQDTAFQAGYLNDKHGQFTKRQLIYQVILDEVRRDDDAVSLSKLPERVYTYGVKLGIFERARNRDEREAFIREETWPILAEFARGGNRRISLEGLGLLSVRYFELRENLEERPEAREFADKYGLTLDEVYGLALTILDEMRTRRALDHKLLTVPIQFREEKVEGFDRDLRPVGYGERAIPKGHAYKILPLVTKSGSPSQFQVYLRKVLKRADNSSAAEPVRDLIKLLQDLEYLNDTEIGKPEDNTHALMVDHRTIELVPIREGQGYKCGACKRVYTCNVRGVCPATRCTGTLQPLHVDHDNYYVHTYLERQLVRLSPHEHSSQLDGRTREEYEEAFRKGAVNVLVCTPTLELGVDIGDLPVVMMRNIPPSPANYAQRSGRAGRAERIALIVAFARNRGHDTYYYDKPSDMIRGVVRAPVFGFDNQRIIRRHVHALILEKLQEQFPSVMGDIVDEEDRLVGIQPLIDELKLRRSTIQRAVADAFARDTHAGGLPWLTGDYVASVIATFPAALERAFRPWLVERRGIIQAIEELLRVRLSAEQQNRLKTLQIILYKMEKDPLRAYLLSYLSRQGFLPAYVFVGDQVRMVPWGETRDPLLRNQDIALTEFALGNLVYCDGNIFKIVGLDFQRSDAPESDTQYRICKRCGMVTLNPIAQHCENCEIELDTYAYLEVRSFMGAKTRSITAAEESRAGMGYVTQEYLLDEAGAGEQRIGPAGFDLTYHRNATIFAANSGFTQGNVQSRAPRGFEICTTCGWWHDPHQESRDQNHRKRCSGTVRAYHLAYRLETDVLEIDVPGRSGEQSERDSFLVTLRNALVLGANIALQTEEGEIAGFERKVPCDTLFLPQIVLYDDVAGGAGYVERLSTMLPEAAAAALERLVNCACVDSCYRCLRGYRNQTDHALLDKRQVIDTLQRIVEAAAIPSIAHKA